MPPHRLNLKVNAVVMLLRNLSLRQDLCNGTRLKVTHMHKNCIQASILTGANQGNEFLILCIKLAPSDTNLPFILERDSFL
ncbi:ATP-dependent DNA helicase [Caligus rogercresseyi]|uniref:ATP-dependent DNA helicase n=1 Tax=Caligus rogercresseyi TaxID=217165 RepID=A0A7T8KBT5_CALRO|nr:ATP-dependent DNA helicase [Caligus rogercresseyi]